jgi:molybdopterin adenylyltransferase
MIRVAIVTVSDSAVAGTREDRSGPALERRIAELGWSSIERRVVPDEVDEISRTLMELAAIVDVALSTGGTGISARDVTPEAVSKIADKEIVGLGEVMRAEGRKSTKFAPLSRSSAYVHGSTLILTLPGSPRGAVDSLNAVCDLIPHVVDLLHGRTEHTGTINQKLSS